MLRIRLLLLIVLVLSSVTVFAQDEASDTIYYYVEINRYNQDDEVESAYAESLLQGVQEALTNERINPVFVSSQFDLSQGGYPDFVQPYEAVNQDLFNPPQSVISVSITTYDEIDSISVTPYAGYEFAPLPMGSMGWVSIESITPEDPDSLDRVVDLVAGIGLYILQDCEHAGVHLQRLTASNTEREGSFWLSDLGVAFYEAGCAYLQGDVNRAIARYTDALNIEIPVETDADPRLYSDNTAINLAWVYAQQGDTDAAISLLDAYYDLELAVYSTREFERFMDRAEVYLLVDDVEAAIGEIDRIIDIGRTEGFLGSEMAWLFTARGWVYARAGNAQAALNDYDVAIATDATYPVAYFRRGQLFYDTEQYDKAKDDFEQFIALAPDFYNYYEQYVQGLIPQAEEYLVSIP